MVKMEKVGKRCGFFALLLCLLMLFSLPLSAARERQRLVVGGMPFGVRFLCDGVLVVGYCDVKCGGRSRSPAREAGVRPGDCILAVNGRRVGTAMALQEAVTANGNGALSLLLRREGEELTVALSPLCCEQDGRPRTGLWVRDSGAGIGTVTFIKEDTLAFGGLGHGICDGESGALIPIARGSVMGVSVSEIKRGAVGAPGELRGHFLAERNGTLIQNTACGVFGVLTDCPASPAGTLPIGYRTELHDGAATLWCTLNDNVTRGYGIEISDIHRNATGNKCFTVTVTDMELLEKTGGIVQGMSGSPIVQDGRLVGAVTHVLIGDPTTGYGIFIENMLNAAQMPMAKAS